MAKRRVIIVTDGDSTAQEAVEIAAHDLNLYMLKLSGKPPSALSEDTVLQLILQAPYEPVVVMVDDNGQKGRGPGENLIEYLINHDDCLNIIGVVAIASNTPVERGIKVDFSVNAKGQVVNAPVDKDGIEEPPKHKLLEGDTVEILKNHPQLLVIGCGDPGKMNYRDTVSYGAFVTSRCFQEILERSEIPHG
ncbi:MAG: stage V sporulation protein AE [Syntrophomonadaceae bacterium]|jgi:stage V sporulation protein AE